MKEKEYTFSEKFQVFNPSGSCLCIIQLTFFKMSTPLFFSGLDVVYIFLNNYCIRDFFVIEKLANL